MRRKLYLEQLEDRSVPSILVTGPDAGGGPDIRVFDQKTGQLTLEFNAYDPAFTGGVRVTEADVNGDGTPDIITAPGPGGGPDIRVFDSKTGVMIREIIAYNPAFTGGVFVAVGDFNVDGKADIVTGPDTGGGPDIRVFDGATGGLLREFMAYTPGFTGGVRVAAGDVRGSGNPLIILAPGPGGGPDVRIYDYFIPGQLMWEKFVYDLNFTGGVYVTAGHIASHPGPPRDDIICTPGPGGGPNVRVIDWLTLDIVQDYMAYSPAFTGGVRVTIADVNGDGFVDVVTGPGPTGGPVVRIFDGTNGAPLNEFFAYDPIFTGGIFVGGG